MIRCRLPDLRDAGQRRRRELPAELGPCAPPVLRSEHQALAARSVVGQCGALAWAAVPAKSVGWAQLRPPVERDVVRDEAAALRWARARLPRGVVPPVWGAGPARMAGPALAWHSAALRPAA